MKRSTERTSIRLEPMRMDDLETVLLIEHQSFTMPWSRGMFQSEIRSETSRLLAAWLEEEPRQLVGYIGYRIVVGEMHIVIVAVDPAWRRQGIATQMLREALLLGRKDDCVRATLEVRMSNHEAQQLYFRYRFAPVGTRPKYYMRPSEDALILWRDPL